MKKILASAALAALLTAQAAAASPAGSLTVNGAPLEAAGSYVHQNTTYVPLRAVAEALRPDAVVAWETDRAAIRADGLEVTARPGDTYIRANGRTLAAPHGVHLGAGRTLVPVRVLAEAMGASVHWNSATGAVFLADVRTLSALPQSEMAEVRAFDALPDELTYPAITPVLFRAAWEHFPGCGL